MSAQRAEVHWARYLDGNRRVVLEADHARIVAERVAEVTDALIDARREALAELEQAHAAALAGMYELGKADGHLLGEEKAHRDSVIVHEGAAESRGYRRGLAAAPRTLTADDVLAAVNAIDYDAVLAATPAPKTARAQVYTLHALTRDAILTLIHDGEATPQGKPCSTCGEPVAYLTARPGWAGGWLHHPARPLDGHPAAIDGEA